MRTTGIKMSVEKKAKLLDEIVEILLDCHNRKGDIPKEIEKQYRTPANWAGYRIMLHLWGQGVIEKGGAQETLNI